MGINQSIDLGVLAIGFERILSDNMGFYYISNAGKPTSVGKGLHVLPISSLERLLGFHSFWFLRIVFLGFGFLKFLVEAGLYESKEKAAKREDALHRIDQFLLELTKVPRVESKLRVFSFKIQFSSQVSDLRKALNVFNNAAEETLLSSGHMGSDKITSAQGEKLIVICVHWLNALRITKQRGRH